MSRTLRITLYVVTVYLGLFGILFLFAPRIFERVTQSTIRDAKLTLLYGLCALIFSYVAFMAARENRVDSKLLLTIRLLTVGHVIIFGYVLITGMEGFSQAGPPMIVNFVLSVLLISQRRAI